MLRIGPLFTAYVTNVDVDRLRGFAEGSTSTIQKERGAMQRGMRTLVVLLVTCLVSATALANFTPTGAMAGMRYEHTATLLPNGKVLIVGGITLSTTGELYDPVAGSFSLTGGMVAPSRMGHTATLLPNGKVLITGGFSCFTPVGCPLGSAEVYDSATGSFTATGSMIVPRGAHSATLLPNGKVLIVGGFGSSFGVGLASAELYDPSTGSFTATGQMTNGRARHTATLLPNGKVLVAGGLDYAAGYIPAAELYDPATGSFGATGSINAPRWSHTATLLQNGKVLIAGGTGNTGYLASGELYDQSTGSFATTGNMATARTWHSATLLSSGRVLVVGGLSANTTFDTAELYNPATGTFAPAGPMTTRRSEHSATLLPNGKVLVAGGDILAVGALSTAELYSLYVRRNINTLSANEIAALRTGIQVMQSRSALNAADPTGWIYQANIHGTVDTPVLVAWNTCQHGSFFFLSWHRMYLYYFERILRKASGTPDLTLPYWNYSDPSDPNATALPLPFRQPADPTTNFLYVSQRDSLMNAGGLMPPSAVSLAALIDPNFSSPLGSGLSFGGQTVAAPCHRCGPHSDLERTPHDNVHVLISGNGSGCPGGGGWMGCFEFAARDPIFWLHHANIDRLWEQWLAQGGGRSDPANAVWLATQFQFFDENGQAVQLSGQQVVDTAAELDYIYNDDPWVDGVLRLAPKATAPQPEKRPARRLGTSAVPALQLGGQPGTVRVRLVSEREFRLRAEERAIALNVEGIEFDKMPSGYYEIYLNLPQGGRPDFRSKYYVGNLSFFGIKPRAQRHEGEEPPRQDYNITEIVAKLKSSGEWRGQEAKVTFVRQHVIPPPGMREAGEVVPVRIRQVTITTE